MNSEIKERIEGLQTFIREFAEMHKEANIEQQSFNAFIITLDNQLKDILGS